MVRTASGSHASILNLTVFGRVGDHIGGLLCLLASAMNGDGGTVPGVEDPRAGAVSTKRVYFTRSHTSFDLTHR